MERKLKVAGVLFGDKGYMRTNRGNKTTMGDNKQPLPDNDIISIDDGDSFLRYLQTNIPNLFKRQKMAEIKGMWIILNLIGVPVYILGIVNNLDNYKSAILFLMGLLYSVTVLMRSYEKWRKEKIANDREEFHLRMEKDKKPHLKHR